MLQMILGALVLGAAVFFAGQAATAGQRRVQAQVRRAAAVSRGPGPGGQAAAKPARERLLQPAVAWLSDLSSRLSPGSNKAQLQHRLRAAGMATSVQHFLAAKSAFSLSAIAIGMVGTAAGKPVLLPAGIGFAALSFIMPDMVVNRRTRARRQVMARQLPDVLDLLTVSVEAGLGFDSAVDKVVEYMDGPLVDELDLTLREIRYGESRAQALRNLAERSESAEVAAFARAIIQADELGTSLGRTLRVQSQDIRVKRQLDAEEKAAKAPIKMMFPTVMFILPALFIVILGPAALAILDQLDSVS